jgi:hypothetical protein
MVAANGLTGEAALAANRFRRALVNGVVLIRGSPLSGGRLADRTSSRAATYSANVGNFIS